MGLVINKKGVRRVISFNVSLTEYCIIRDKAMRDKKRIGPRIREALEPILKEWENERVNEKSWSE